MTVLRTVALVLGVMIAVPGAATTAAAAPSPTPTPTASQAPQPPPPTIEVAPQRVVSGGATDVTVYTSDGPVELYAANRGEGVYALIRSGQVVGNRATFQIRPDRHKTLYARLPDERTANRGISTRVDVAVAARVGLGAVRNGTRDYTFAGRVQPSVSSVVSLWRVDTAGRPVLTARASTSADGGYRIRRLFTGAGRFLFFTTVPTTAAADAGSSPRRSTLIY
jgi:hypothetical protein